MRILHLVLLGLMSGVATPSFPNSPVLAEARAVNEAPARISNPPPASIEAAPRTTDRITAPSVTAPKIEPRTDSTPAIVRPPIGNSPIVVRPAVSAEVQRELQRLQRAAEPRRGGYGSTAASAQAAWILGLVYLHGAGLRRDTDLAQIWFDRAAGQGREPWAYAGQAWCAIDGCHGPSDPASARRAIAQLRAKHPARANFLEWVLLAREAPLQVAVPGASQMEIKLPHQDLLQKSAAEGDMHALIELGLNAVTNNDLEAALGYFQRAGKDSQAARANIRQIESRMNSRRQSQSATSASSSAAELLAAARKFHRGIGVPVNYVEAVRLYRLAEAKGSVEAKKMLSLIFSRPAPGGSIDIGWMQQLAYADPTTTIPSIGVPGSIDLLYREPTPLYDLLPEFWRKQIPQMAR